MIGAVLFDMDGVLVDSEEVTRLAAVLMFEEKGYRVLPEDFIPFAGVSALQSLGGVAKKYGVPFHAGRDKERTYQIYQQICTGRISALPGVFDFLQLCKSRRLKTAVTTSADKVKMLINLKEAGLPLQTFDAAVFAEMVRKTKPDPEIYLTASEMLGMQPADCLVIEDAPSGLQAAAAAGMKSLALSTTFPPGELRLADWIIPDLSYVREEFLD